MCVVGALFSYSYWAVAVATYSINKIATCTQATVLSYGHIAKNRLERELSEVSLLQFVSTLVQFALHIYTYIHDTRFVQSKQLKKITSRTRKEQIRKK